MTPERAPRDEEGKVGRWAEDGAWACDCVDIVNLNLAISPWCTFCGTARPPMTETPTVGRWQYWLCGCTPAHNQNVMLPSEPECRECGTVRPPLPATPAPMSVTGTVTATIVTADDAQVVGKEPIAGVDDAGRVKDAIVPLSLDERMALEDSQCFENCGACVNACGDAPDGMPFRVAVARRDIWHALRFASTTQAIAQLDEVAGRMGISPCGDAETVAAFHLRVTDAIVATLRAVPVEGGEPVAWGVFLPDGHFLESFENEQAAKREAAQLHRDAGDVFAVRALYAHPAPDAEVRDA